MFVGTDQWTAVEGSLRMVSAANETVTGFVESGWGRPPGRPPMRPTPGWMIESLQLKVPSGPFDKLESAPLHAYALPPIALSFLSAGSIPQFALEHAVIL